MIQKTSHQKGSILIWTMLIGVMLSSVFFFQAFRLYSSVAMQRNVMVIQGRSTFLESYIGYLKGLTHAQLEGMGSEIDFDEITGTLTNNVTDEITGVLDDGENAEYPIDGQVKVEWNLCVPVQENGQINIVPTGGITEGNCASSSEYDDFTDTNPTGSLSITSTFSNLHYRITPIGETQLKDKDWTATLEYKKVHIQETFSPQP